MKEAKKIHGTLAMMQASIYVEKNIWWICQLKCLIWNYSKVSVKGKDNILIRLKDGRHQFISNFIYVPNITNNSLSLRELLKKGYDIHLKDLSLSIKYEKNNLITKVKISEEYDVYVQYPKWREKMS